MLKKATDQDIDGLINYSRKYRTNVLYLYADLVHYRCTDPNIEYYYSQTEGHYNWIISIVNNTSQLLLTNKDEIDELINLINTKKIKIITGSKQTLGFLSEHLDVSKKTTGFIMRFTGNIGHTCANCCNSVDFDQIAQLICSDSVMGEINTKMILEKELRNRYTEKFGRSVVISIDNKIVAHAATYAECDNIAVISGVIVDEEYRSKGYGKKIVSFLCKQLSNDGIIPFIYCHSEIITNFYRKIGFVNDNEIMRLFINH